MSKSEVMDQLFFVLTEKIYSTNPALIRNDTKTAKLVAKYISEISSVYRGWLRRKGSARSYFENEAIDSYHKAGLLLRLSEDTLRKYIAELWSADAFVGFSFSKDVNPLE